MDRHRINYTCISYLDKYVGKKRAERVNANDFVGEERKGTSVDKDIRVLSMHAQERIGAMVCSNTFTRARYLSNNLLY